MSTPESVKEIRNGTHTSGGIRKSLLTPCRRIGLPRIKKTTNSTSFKSPLQTNEAPLKCDSPSSPVNSTLNLDEPTITSIPQNKRKKLPRKLCQKQDVNNDVNVSFANDNCTKLCKSKQEDKTLENREKNGKIGGSDHSVVNKKDKKVNDQDRIEINFNDNCQSSSKTKKKQIMNSIDTDVGTISINGLKSEREKETQIANSQGSDDSDVVICHNSSKIKRRKHVIDSDDDDEQFNGFQSSANSNESLEISKKRLSTETMEECKMSDIEANIIPVNKNNLIDEISNTDHNKTKPKPKCNKSIRRKLSLKKSASYDDSFEDDPIFSKSSKEENRLDCNSETDRETLIDEIMKLQKTIEDKECEVQRSRQAEIYRNLHKVDDLISETEMWKIGCQDGLRDLLTKLNEHTKIEMDALLSQLKVPQDLFTYDAENDCFVNGF